MLACGPGDMANHELAATFAAHCFAAPRTDETPAPPMQASATEGEDKAIVVEARPPSKADPLEAVNVRSFAAVQAVDRAVIGPAALGYQHVVPEPARDGLRNFFRNLREPVVFVNYLLQLKPGRAVRTAGRFALNSSIGAAGLIDMAKRKPFHLPYHANGFANTLAYYGVKPGPFLFLPLVGPTTVRDLVGLAADTVTMPLSVGRPIPGPAYPATATAVKVLDHRAEDDVRLRALRDNNPNAYGSIRAAYLEQRQAEIDELRGIRHEPDSATAELALANPSRSTN